MTCQIALSSRRSRKTRWDVPVIAEAQPRTVKRGVIRLFWRVMCRVCVLLNDISLCAYCDLRSTSRVHSGERLSTGPREVRGNGHSHRFSVTDEGLCVISAWLTGQCCIDASHRIAEIRLPVRRRRSAYAGGLRDKMPRREQINMCKQIYENHIRRHLGANVAQPPADSHDLCLIYQKRSGNPRSLSLFRRNGATKPKAGIFFT